MKINIMEDAKPELTQYVGKNVRIYSSGSGLGGPRIAMALDEPKENDLIVEEDGISFVVDKKLVNYLPAVTIGFRKGWFGSGLFVEAGNYNC